MPTQRDIDFGRVALERGLVRPEHLRQLYARLPPQTTLRDALVQSRLLTPQQAAWIDGQLSAGAQTVARGPTTTVQRGPGAQDSTATVRPSGSGSGSDSGLSRSGSGIVGLPEPGTAIEGRYVIEDVLGKGGMGAVYRARDVQRGEAVAVKVMLPDANPDGRALARFRREAEAVATVDAHAGIVRIRAFGLHDGVMPYAVLDLVEGRDLHAIVKDTGPLAIDDALRLTEGVARAIHHCHGLGVLHRDLKPANVLRRTSDDTPHVTDFGLALDNAAERLTRTGEVMGTPAYMSPEQAEGTAGDVDHLTDVYALGAILYELVTGRAPFVGGPMQILKRVFLNMPDPVVDHRPDAPPGVNAICQMAMAKDRDARYPSAEAFADDLSALRRGDPVVARPPSRLGHYTWRLRRGDLAAWLRLLLSALPLLLAAAGVTDYARTGNTERRLRDALTEELPGIRSKDPLARDPKGAERITQVQLLQSVAAWGRSLAESKQPRDTPFVAAALREARSGRADDGFSRVLTEVEADEPGTLALLDRLVARVGLHEGDGWQGSPALLSGEEPEAKLLKALTLLRWGEGFDQGAAWESGGTVAAIASLHAAEALLNAVKEKPGDQSFAAAQTVLGTRDLAETCLAHLTSDAGQGWNTPWSELDKQADPHSAHMRAGLLYELKPDALQKMASGLELPPKGSSAWEKNEIYDRLGRAADALAAVADDVPAVDRQEAILILITRALELKGAQRSDVLERLLKRFFAFASAHLDGSHRERLRTVFQGDLTYGLAELLAQRAQGLATNEDALKHLLVYADLGIMPITGNADGILAEFEREGVWERILRRKPTGNGYFFWAFGSEMILSEKEWNQPRKLREIAGRYAIALGERLSRDEWSSLNLGASRPRTPEGIEPLGSTWEPLALHGLAALALRDRFGPAHREVRQLASLRLEHRAYALCERIQIDARLYTLRDLATHSREVREGLPAGHPKRSVLATRERQYIAEGLRVGWHRLEQQTKRRSRGDSSESTQAVLPASLSDATAQRIASLIRHEALLLANKGRGDEAIALFEPARRRLAELGERSVPNLIEGLAKLHLQLKHLEEAEREAKRLVAHGEGLLNEGGRATRTRGRACVSSGTCLLALIALERGDRDEALRIYKEDISSGRSKRRSGPWNELEIKLGLVKRSD